MAFVAIFKSNWAALLHLPDYSSYSSVFVCFIFIVSLSGVSWVEFVPSNSWTTTNKTGRSSSMWCSCPLYAFFTSPRKCFGQNQKPLWGCQRISAAPSPRTANASRVECLTWSPRHAERATPLSITSAAQLSACRCALWREMKSAGKVKQCCELVLHEYSDPLISNSSILALRNSLLCEFLQPKKKRKENCQFYYFECQPALKTDVAP